MKSTGIRQIRWGGISSMKKNSEHIPQFSSTFQYICLFYSNFSSTHVFPVQKLHFSSIFSSTNFFQVHSSTFQYFQYIVATLHNGRSTNRILWLNLDCSFYYKSRFYKKHKNQQPEKLQVFKNAFRNITSLMWQDLSIRIQIKAGEIAFTSTVL